jgi:tetratricopeptide (TPR) repeat protein
LEQTLTGTGVELQDQRHLIAAEGWLELGDAQEAAEELKQLSPENRDHPLVLGLRWQICAKAKQWDVALETASTLIQSAPEHPLGWVHRSYCLHELKRTEEARDNLLRVVEKFPDDPIMRYNLACYECQLGRLDKAKSWLQKALERGDRQKIRSMALEDLDLQPLWKEIEDL